MANQKFPKVRFGEPVAWYQGGSTSSAPHLAFVTNLGVGSMVGLRIFPQDSERCPPVQGCRHAADAEAKDNERALSGAWETLDEYQEREDERKKVAANQPAINLSTMRKKAEQPKPELQPAS